MVAYSFKSRFGAPILAGTKAQTIRAERTGKSRHARPGELVQLYTGMRTRQCQKLGEARCLEVLPVKIDLLLSVLFIGDVCFGGPKALDEFAQQDGFADWHDLVAFWVAEHPGVDLFEGVLIRWQPLPPASELDIAGVAA
ncbi:hypothetical protein MKK84_24560 [Methylobacterium sp. E-065]|uniref:hypothetical protein n=1 Tax=Methylobacterium sp. E-065 TaxID=2836583 RepID=UPI001FBA391E|nr:hypothetical protein [Methylobacterium sp. E-065]MCJ2020561.1 hypothetical protein [Methylobacterium sp. E-065]